MDRLIIRDGELRGAITSVRTSRSEFAHAVSRTDALQEAVGHGGLSGALQGFESCWSVRREKLVTSLEVIEKQLQGVLDTFGEWDRANTSSQQSTGEAAPTPASVAESAPPAPATPVGPAAGDSPSVTPPVAAPDSVPSALEPTPPSDGDQSPAGATPPPDAVVDPSTDDPDSPVLPGTPEAINDLLDRLERLADSPAGLAALAGSLGALVVLLALFAPGSAVAPGLAGVDGARVKTLLDRYTASTEDAFDGLTGTTSPPSVTGVDIEQQLKDLDVATAIESEVSADVADQSAVDDIVSVEDASGDADTDDAASTDQTSGPRDNEVDVEPESPGGEPSAPSADTGGGAPGSAPLPDLPPPPDSPSSIEGDARVSNSAFDQRFPDTPAGGAADLGPVADVSAVDVDSELVALAEGGADSGPEQSNAISPRMPMVAGGMGSMAAASAGHAVTSVQNKGGDHGNGADRLAEVRRELDELRTTTEKEEKP